MTVEACYARMGGDYRDVLERLGTDARIVKYLGKFVKNQSFESLCHAVDDGLWQEAFTHAHSLKGQCLNLSLSSLARSSEALCDCLRGKEPEERALDLFAGVVQEYQKTELAALLLLREREAAKV